MNKTDIATPRSAALKTAQTRHHHGAQVLEEPNADKLLREFLDKLRTREARIGVVGLGYVGLPLVRLFASKGFRVTGFDVDGAKIAALRRGESYLHSIPPDTIAELRKEGKLDATEDFRRLAGMDAIIVCVPTPLTLEGKPDLSYVRNTAKTIARTLTRGQLVSLESTSYPGTTREVALPELQAGGLRCGRDFFLAYSPEREDPGNTKWTNETIPKVVGGMDQASLRAAAALYGQGVKQVVEVSSCEVAEAAKLLENIFRCVNIALVNELKMCFDKMRIDIWEVIQAARTKPFGFMPFYPGPGPGGHCIPVDPFYLSWKAREYQFETRFIQLAGELNARIPFYVVGKLEEALANRGRSLAGAEILLLGLAYKKDSDDPRESPSFKIAEAMVNKGARVVYNDPHIPRLPAMRHYRHLKIRSVELTNKELSSKDAVVIATDHSSYDYHWIVSQAPLVVDTRNACRWVPDDLKWKVVQA